MIAAQLQGMLSIPTVREFFLQWSVGESNSGPNNSIIKTCYMLLSKFLSSISSFVRFHKTRKPGDTSELNDLISIAIFVRLLFQRPIKALTARAMLVYNRTKIMVPLRDQAAMRYSKVSSFVVLSNLRIQRSCMISITDIICQSHKTPHYKKVDRIGLEPQLLLAKELC